MSIVWVFISGTSPLSRTTHKLMTRANRAQFADVYLRHINEDDDLPEIGVPTVQGVSDNIGESVSSVYWPRLIFRNGRDRADRSTRASRYFRDSRTVVRGAAHTFINAPIALADTTQSRHYPSTYFLQWVTNNGADR
jgi:hypothetical protein